MAFMDVYLSVVSLLLVGWLAGLLAQALRLPRVVVMIFAGIALMPAVHPTVLSASKLTYGPASATTVTYGPAGTYAAQSPASSIRTMALLVALMRGGLNVKMPVVWAKGLPVAALAFLPYVFELAVEAAVAPALLPGYYSSAAKGTAPSALVTWTSASVWAPLSPSIVIPNTLLMVEAGFKHTPQVILTGAPLEVSTALVVEGVMAGVQTALNAGSDPAVTLAHIPVYVIGSALYGLAFSLAFYAYTLLRARPEVARRGFCFFVFGPLSPWRAAATAAAAPSPPPSPLAPRPRPRPPRPRTPSSCRRRRLRRPRAASAGPCRPPRRRACRRRWPSRRAA